MSAEKCGQAVLTSEMISEAIERAANQSGSDAPMRLISVRANNMLKRIHQKEPGWDSWTVEAEIWWKARRFGILEDE
jgi:hypothetical protein